MGYPMTWRRTVMRNGLHDGDYDGAPMAWDSRVNTNEKDDAIETIGRVRRERVEQYERQAKMLAGDIRRMENDARDEGMLCDQIAARTGIDSDVVAAVLLEFFAT